MKLSIIIPIYKVEDYLRKCIDSVLNQDLSSSEYDVILVDDGSPDGCPQICDEYAAKYGNIRVIHQKNGGLSAARNAGMKVAKGEYVCFVDSDDYWEPNVLGRLMAQIERDNLDVLRFKYQNVNERYELFNPNKSDPYKNDDYSTKPTDGVSFLNSRFGTACYAVMFVVRRTILIDDRRIDNRSTSIEDRRLKIDDCLFKEGIYFEDVDWTPRMLCRANRVASTSTVVYNYLIRPGSISRAINRKRQQKVMNDLLHIVSEMREQSEMLKFNNRDNSWYCRMIASNIVNIIGIISRDFYKERKIYIKKLKKLQVYPIKIISIKASLINLSPIMVVEFLHWKNKERH